MTTKFDMFIETQVPKNELIISRTDLKGIITYVNDTFASISGYEPDELIGKPHNIIRHPDMPKSIFKDLWDTLSRGDEWQGYVKNLRKDKGYYWVFAKISPLIKDGNIIGYKSLREPVDRDKKIEMQNFYDELREKEEDKFRVVLYVDREKLKSLKDLED